MPSVAESPVFTAARALASWVGGGRAVTPSIAIKPALVPDAALALGVACPVKVRRLSDVPELQRAWLTAVAAGLVTIEGSRAVRAEPAPALDVEVWYAALEQVIAAQLTDPCEVDSRICCLVTLDLLAEEAPPLGGALREAVEQGMRQRGDGDWRFVRLADRHPVDHLLTILVAQTCGKGFTLAGVLTHARSIGGDVRRVGPVFAIALGPGGRRLETAVLS
ncbi:hypothetical protein AB0I81_17385 [Nonomuraea sp. NPDC050404]|uniref:hypothetical protein n=1 Tax=Nonomuraea sp. NPDC050404 TaxID=3155783 RepID=UPI0033EE8F0F